jgi:His-Xaa-Ser system radical SAM maturase HxsC
LDTVNLLGKATFREKAEPYLGLLEEASGSRFRLRNISSPAASPLALQIGSPTDDRIDVLLPPEFHYLSEGDILRLNPVAGNARALYRRSSRHNFLFFTERCNSRCLMCSQPPREVDDGYLVDDILTAIPWMSPDTPELGITGGEPTLLHEKLLEVLRSTKAHLPKTSLHMLSNGRLFSYGRYAQQVARVDHPDFMIGVPLYADTAAHHDFVVQARGAFDQTVLGLLNLARFGVRIELRIVIHRYTFERLSKFATFVARNLPFVDQVSLMGLELMGYARSNLDALWVDPADYHRELSDAVAVLDAGGIKTHIFNHQLCVLPSHLHPFARKSISDWKNLYMPACEGCEARDSCGGFFASSTLRASRHIAPIRIHASV